MERYIMLLIWSLFVTITVTNGQGTCVSPDGPMSLRTTLPADFAELQADGNCMSGTGSTSWHDMCFTFTPTGPSIEINMGYATTCNNGAFRNMRLYDNTCALHGAGLVFNNLTPNEEYTFCIEMRANGGAVCNGFDDVCPYYIQNNVMPVKMLEMHCDSGQLTWITATEINNDFFTVYKSDDIDDWEYKLDVGGAGTKNTRTLYTYYDADCTDETYYRIDQTDYDGTTSFEGIVHCECDEFITPEYIIEEYNIMGQVWEGKGLKIIKVSKEGRIIYKKIHTQ